MTPQQLIVAIAVVWGISGLVEPHLPEAGEIYNAVGVAQGIATAFLLFAWCKTHARANSIDPPAGAALLIALIAFVGIPYYAFKGFGLRRGVRLVGFSILSLVAFGVAYVVCFEISALFVF